MNIFSIKKVLYTDGGYCWLCIHIWKIAICIGWSNPWRYPHKLEIMTKYHRFKWTKALQTEVPEWQKINPSGHY